MNKFKQVLGVGVGQGSQVNKFDHMGGRGCPHVNTIEQDLWPGDPSTGQTDTI